MKTEHRYQMLLRRARSHTRINTHKPRPILLITITAEIWGHSPREPNVLEAQM